MSSSTHLQCVRSACIAALLAVPLATAQTPTQATTPSQSRAASPAGAPPAQSTAPSGTTPTVTGQSTSSLPSAPGVGTGVAIPAHIGKSTVATPLPNASITLDQALALAVANEPIFVAAAAAAQTAKLDRSIARAGALPTAVYHNQFLYTQPNTAGARVTDASGAVKFIANNTVHEYVSQLSVSENLGLTQYTALQRAEASLAVANAELEIARRGLTSTVVGLFYNLVTGQTKVAVQQRAVDEAAGFVQQTQAREAAREVAHADVIKAQLQLQQHQRDRADAQLQFDKARLDLGVLIYPDPRTPYTVTVPDVRPMPERASVESLASANDAELKSALAGYRSSQIGVTAAAAGFLPDLAVNYSFGIDAPQFAVTAPDGSRNLGYSASATLDIPLFDWFATSNRLKQARIARDASKVVLSNTQRRVIANLEEFFAETQVAYDSLTSLQQSVSDARESLRLTRLRYTNGEASVLEVVDAENTLTTTDLALGDGTARYQLSLANLQTLTGTI